MILFSFKGRGKVEALEMQDMLISLLLNLLQRHKLYIYIYIQHHKLKGMFSGSLGIVLNQMLLTKMALLV